MGVSIRPRLEPGRRRRRRVVWVLAVGAWVVASVLLAVVKVNGSDGSGSYRAGEGFTSVVLPLAVAAGAFALVRVIRRGRGVALKTPWMWAFAAVLALILVAADTGQRAQDTVDATNAPDVCRASGAQAFPPLPDGLTYGPTVPLPGAPAAAAEIAGTREVKEDGATVATVFAIALGDPSDADIDNYFAGAANSIVGRGGSQPRQIAFGRNGGLAGRADGNSIIVTVGSCHGYRVDSLAGSTSREVAQDLLVGEGP